MTPKWVAIFTGPPVQDLPLPNSTKLCFDQIFTHKTKQIKHP